jgi:hypothetical protein
MTIKLMQLIVALLIASSTATGASDLRMTVGGHVFQVEAVPVENSALVTPTQSDTWGMFEDRGMRLLFAHQTLAGKVLFDLAEGDPVLFLYPDGSVESMRVSSCAVEELHGDEAGERYCSTDDIFQRYGPVTLMQTCYDATRKEVLIGNTWLCCVPTSILLCKLREE